MFTSRGLQNVTLNGMGTPLDSGYHTFTVKFGASTCNFKIYFNDAVVPPVETCHTTAFGNFKKGVALTNADHIQMTVSIVPYIYGTYTFSTGMVNGISFTTTNTFSGTGSQTIILTGSGTPLNSGAFNFIVNFGVPFNPSTCNFMLSFSP